ncbi:MAG: TonB-dependent receptor domain-containing protein [Flavisolibacter sp.]
MFRLYFIILLVCSAMAATAQQDARITGRFENIDAASFFKQIESTSPYYFYYDAAQLKDVRVQLSVSNQPIQKVLEQAFAGTDIKFAIDAQNRVFISRKVAVSTTLPAGYFSNTASDVEEQKIALQTAGERPVNKVSSEVKTYEIGVKSNQSTDKNIIITGYVRNERSGEPVINAVVFADQLNVGVQTDQYGYYRLNLPPGSYTINVQGIGMKDSKYNVVVYGPGQMDIDLKEQINVLKTVVVSAQKVANLKQVQLGVERLNMDAIRRVPTVFGEADVMRVVLTLPGVKTVGEASTGFNVRGGSADQNLVLMNGATIYNPSHFFGMFSAFNPELVKDIELYKSSIPAKYGGRLSSVLDINLKEGNKKNVTGSAGIGLVTGRFNIEGPLAKNKTSFVAGARSTYANWLLKLLPTPYDRSEANFYDANLSIHHQANNKNNFYLNAYTSEDKFNLASDTTYGYSNQNFNINWKHNFSSKLLAVFSTGIDKYQYRVHSDKNVVNAYTLDFGIDQYNFKTDFSYFLNLDHTLDFGLSTIRYKLTPGSFQPLGDESLVVPDIVPAEQAQESALYLSEKFNVSPDLSITGGVRYSFFNYLGPGTVNYYAAGLPKDENNVVESKNYAAGNVINTYHGPEFRLAARYSVTPSFSVKAGYNSLRQYIHMLSNTTAIAPTDIWKLSDPNIRPQQGDQVSLGLYKNLKENTIETSVEVYYKKIKDYLDYKPGANLVLNHHVETDVVSTRGKAYGAEVSIKKTTGKLNGWLSYTYSRILLQMDDSTIGNPVNGGNWYPANYDKPHDLTAVLNFKVNHRFSLSLNTTYSTGRPITLPIGRFYYGGSQRVLYSDRNAYRIPDYFRADFSMNIDGNYKVNQRTHNSWTLGVYNLTGRKNPFSVYYVSENGNVNGYRLSIFGSAIPFINFNIHF